MKTLCLSKNTDSIFLDVHSSSIVTHCGLFSIVSELMFIFWGFMFPFMSLVWYKLNVFICVKRLTWRYYQPHSLMEQFIIIYLELYSS